MVKQWLFNGKGWLGCSTTMVNDGQWLIHRQKLPAVAGQATDLATDSWNAWVYHDGSL